MAAAQLDDLRALGVDWDGAVLHQRDRTGAHHDAIAELVDRGLTYPCYCTRREIREASAAPHGEAPEGAYPGTCRDLDQDQRATRAAVGRPAGPPLAGRRAGGDRGRSPPRPVSTRVDDLVLRRGDGVPAYNLAVVVDDAAQGVGEVVRGDDLLLSTPRQAHLARVLGLPEVAYAHVPLVLAPTGDRLAKRDGAVTLADRRASRGVVGVVRSWLAASLGLAEAGEAVSMATLLDRFDPERLPREPWIWRPTL